MLGQPLEQLEHLMRFFAKVLPRAVGAVGSPLSTGTTSWPSAIALVQGSVLPQFDTRPKVERPVENSSFQRGEKGWAYSGLLDTARITSYLGADALALVGFILGIPGGGGLVGIVSGARSGQE